MPRVNVVNTEAMETPNRAQENLETFFSGLKEEYTKKQDKNILSDIYKKYEQNQEDENILDKLQFELEASDLSPTRRLQAQNQFNEMRKVKAAERKALGGQASSVGKEYQKLREKAVGDYVNDAISKGDEAVDQKLAIAEARKAIGGDIAEPGFKAALKNNPYSQMIVGLTPDESSLQAANKQLLSGTKGLFGSKPTEREIFLLLNSMLPSIGKTKEANEAGLAIIEKVNDMKMLRSEIIQRLTEGGSLYVPNLEQQVNEELKPVTDALLEELKEADAKFNKKPEEKKSESQQIKVKAPDGSLWNMTQKQIDDAKEKGVIFEPVKT